MARVNVVPNVYVPASPVCLVGAQVGGKPNFMTVAWVTRVNFKPAMLAVAIGKTHHTPEGIRENRTFSVCFPDAALREKTDCCGMVSGKRVDKASLFQVFYGESQTAPMISECPLCLECWLIQTVDLPTNELFIGEIVGAYCDERILTDGTPDVEKIDPLLLSMPDNRYWKMGESVGKAWHDGKGMADRLKGKG